jgi:hypothetical protein
MMERRLVQISNAKKIFIKGITNRLADSLNTALHSSHSFMDHPRKGYQEL